MSFSSFPTFTNHKNFAYSTVLTPPSNPTTGTTIVLASGTGASFPAAPFDAVCWPSGVQPLNTNAEIMSVTGITGDTLTVIRGPLTSDAGGINVSIAAGYQFSANITDKVLTDIESSVVQVPLTLPSNTTWTIAANTQVLYASEITVNGEIDVYGELIFRP